MNNSGVKERSIKKYRRRAASLGVLVTVFFLYVILILAYFISPISTVKNVTIKGEHYYDNDYMEEHLNIRLPGGKAYLPTFDENEYEMLIEKSKGNNVYSLISDFHCTAKMFSLEVTYKDILPVLKKGDVVYLANGDRSPNNLPDKIGNFTSDEYLSSLPIFIEDKYTLDANKDPQLFADVTPDILTSISYIKRNSQNTFYIYVTDDDIKNIFGEDSFICFKVSTDKIDSFLKEREFKNSINSIINNGKTLVSTMKEEVINDKIIKVVPINRNTDGE